MGSSAAERLLTVTNDGGWWLALVRHANEVEVIVSDYDDGPMVSVYLNEDAVSAMIKTLEDVQRAGTGEPPRPAGSAFQARRVPASTAQELSDLRDARDYCRWCLLPQGHTGPHVVTRTVRLAAR